MERKRRKYSREEFLKLKPLRKDFEWQEDEGKIKIIVPKFKTKIGKKFCELLGREPTFTANLDERGSLIWKLCDGRHTVEEILENLKKNFPDEENIEQRLFYYLYMLKRLDYIIY
ncbi:MAG TPA: PqqD family protein [Thermoplasmatales archaeon]|nr:PqqD family protein [Thermoplasmatales archaeon]